MGTARKFNNVLHNEIDVHAAWLPVTNTFRLGDYGVISDGVFVKVGNIDEFGVRFNAISGQPTQLKFRSEGIRVRRFVAGVETAALPNADIGAKLVIEFGVADSFFINAELAVQEMQSINQVGAALRKLDAWKRRYRVISSTYVGDGCTILSSRRANSKVEISGRADLLNLLNLGKVDAGLAISAEDDIGLEIVGQSGVLGLRMFKLQFFDGTQVLRGSDGAEIEQVTEADLEDDV